VKTTLDPKGRARARSRAQGSVFGHGTDPWHGRALEYSKDTGKATYTGAPKTRALLQQGSTRILANELVFEEATNRLQGRAMWTRASR
jgi:hypothetical protein